MTIGDRIKAARKDKGLTQKQLEELCGINAANIRKYESGRQNPKIETIKRIANALGVDVYELLGAAERELFVEGEASALFRGVGKDYSFSEPEKKLVLSFNRLNQQGQQKAVERVEELAEIPKYKKE